MDSTTMNQAELPAVIAGFGFFVGLFEQMHLGSRGEVEITQSTFLFLFEVGRK